MFLVLGDKTLMGGIVLGVCGEGIKCGKSIAIDVISLGIELFGMVS